MIDNMDVFKTKKFKTLQNVWAKKLKASGFEDIETEDGALKVSTDPRTISNALAMKESRETYYEVARQLLNDHVFESPGEIKVWEQHCEGIGIRSIAKKVGFSRYKVEKIIRKLKDIAWKR